MPTGEIQPSALKIDRLLSRISEGDIKIPAFQRGFVWSQSQIAELLDSLYRNLPVGSILLWNTNDQLKSSRDIGGLLLPDREPEYPINYVLDGQQRLSTIYAAFCTERQFEQLDGAYAIDPSLFDLSFVFSSEEFLPTTSVDSQMESIPLSCLFDTEAFFSVLERLSPDSQRAAKNLYSRFNNYEIPVVTISKRSKDEVGVIFERINNTGTVLTTLDLLVAWTWSEDFHLQESLNNLSETLESKGFGELPDKIILQCLAGILRESTRTKTILDLSAAEVQESFGDVSDAIARAVDFLATDIGVQSLDFLPHLQQLVGLSFFYSNANTANAGQLSVLRRWFWRTAFSRRYSAQTDDKMDADIQFMTRLLDGDYNGIGDYAVTIEPSMLRRQKFSKRNPYTRALLLLLARKQPLDLTSGARVDVGEALSAYNRKEYHHIFPRAYLKEQSIPSDQISSLCNFCILPAASNKKISKRSPSEYFFDDVPEAIRAEILETNLLPEDMSTYEDNNYDRFLDQRAEKIIDFLSELIN